MELICLPYNRSFGEIPGIHSQTAYILFSFIYGNNERMLMTVQKYKTN